MTFIAKERAVVDIVFDENNNTYLLCINFLHNFIRPQKKITGINLAEYERIF